MGHAFSQLMRYIEHMNTAHWTLVGVLAVVFGVLCMRGMGGRHSY